MRYSHPVGDFPDSKAEGIWQWAALLPAGLAHRVSLGEGSTPLTALHDWNAPSRLFIKNESCNPTWSYKDRAAAVSISMARRFGLSATAAISTGNLGNSVAAYSAAARLGCTIFCNPEAPELQLALMSHYGARVFRGGDQNALMRQLIDRGGVMPASIACPLGGFANPYGIEGFKTIAFEIFSQLGRVPNRVFVPAGSGDGLFGIWKGFCELRDFVFSDRVPRMIACQAESADCYAAALRTGSNRPIRVPHPATIALSIAEEVGGYPALSAIRESGGDAIAVSDGEIRAAMKRIATNGIALEAASAAALAVAERMRANAGEGETWAVIGTGAIAKWPPLVTGGFTSPAVLPPGYSGLDSLLAAS